MNRFFLTGLAVVSAAFAVATAATGAAAAGAPVQVDIQKFAFTPKEITVAPGTTIAWVNHDETPHTISADDQAYVSKALDTDDRYEHTFDHEGDFHYFCTVHPFMVGVVHVHK